MISYPIQCSRPSIDEEEDITAASNATTLSQMSLLDVTDSQPKSLSPFDNLPSEVILLIATFATERSVWALMGTCRKTRGPAEVCLEEYLGEIDLSYKYRIRLDSLLFPHSGSKGSDPYRIAIVDRYKDLLAIYSIAATIAHTLKIYLATGSLYEGRWQIIEALLPHISHLTLDADAIPSWRVNGETNPNVLAFDKSWRCLLYHSLGAKPSRLTNLRIASCEHPFWQFTQIAWAIPNLEILTLDNIDGEQLDSFETTDSVANGYIGLPTFCNLRSINLRCREECILLVCENLLPKCPNLKYLTIDPYPITSIDKIEVVTVADSLRRLIIAIGINLSLEGLALYGEIPDIYTQYISTEQSQDLLSIASFASLRILSIDIPGDLEADIYDVDWSCRISYGPGALLNNSSKIRPRFPALERIEYIVFGYEKAVDYQDLYKESDLRDLFMDYPTLQKVEYIHSNLDLAFRPDLPASRNERVVLFTVTRADLNVPV